MSDAQEINKLRNHVGELQHDLDVARTELQLLRQLNQRLLENKQARVCPQCGTIVAVKE